MLRLFPKTFKPSFLNQTYACYATHANVVWRNGLTPTSSKRKFSPLKTHLFAQYEDILKQNSLLLFLSAKNLPASLVAKIRRDLRATAQPRSASNPVGVPKGSKDGRIAPKLLSVRVHMFLAAMRTNDETRRARKQTVPQLQGPISVIYLPSLDPDHLSSILKVLERATPKVTVEASKPAKKDDLAMPPPGGGGVRQTKEPPVPSLAIVGGLVEGNLFLLPGLKDVTKLPSLETLQSQIIGLLSSPASQLTGVLSQAAGGRVSRTLEGFKQGLEDAAKSS